MEFYGCVLFKVVDLEVLKIPSCIVAIVELIPQALFLAL